jgi:uncharacterized Zn finger protein
MRYYSYQPNSGGIPAISKRGSFGQGWLARKWVDLVEQLETNARVIQGRATARGELVKRIHVAPGTIVDVVQDAPYSYHTYTVEITLPLLTAEAQKRLLDTTRRYPHIAAQIITGQVPPEMEVIGEKASAPLLPYHVSDWQVQCPCYEWLNWCKHAAAVHFLVGEELDRDPLLIWVLRGLARREVIARISGEASLAAPAATAPLPEALPTEPAAFWRGKPARAEKWGVTSTIPSGDWPLRHLGAFPFWSGSHSLQAVLEAFYPAVAEQGREMLVQQDECSPATQPTEQG